MNTNKNYKKRKKKVFNTFNNQNSIFTSNRDCNVTEWVPLVNKPLSSVKISSWFDCFVHDRPGILPFNSRTIKIVSPFIPHESATQQLRSISKNYTRVKNIAIKNSEPIPINNKKPVFFYMDKIRIYPDNIQKNILHSWFEATTIIFNSTIDYIRSLIYVDGKLIKILDAIDLMNAEKIRQVMYENKILVQEIAKFEYKGNTSIPIHVLDEAIKLAVSNHKSCLTNLLEGNIKDFRVRKWSIHKNKKIIKIEANFFKPTENGNGTFCSDVFPKMKSSSKLHTIDRTSTLQYDTLSKKYILFVPKSIEPKTIYRRDKSLGIDLGSRTFITAYSENKTFDICTDNNLKKIKGWHKKIDNINYLLYMQNLIYDNPINNKKPEDKFHDDYMKKQKKTQAKEQDKQIKLAKERKERKEKLDSETEDLSDIPDRKIPPRRKLLKGLRKYHNKIKNQINDMHYKAAHLLVKEYSHIYIGKLSTSSILSKENKTISKYSKRMLQTLSPYKFRQTLRHMGNKNGCKVVEVSEYMTTRTCSSCGKINNIGDSKVHKCSCGMETDRDINSAKTHLKLGIVERLELERQKSENRGENLLEEA